MSDTANGQEPRFTDFYTAFHFLYSHRIFEGRYLQGLYVEVVKVDPETESISDDEARNTATRVWLETGPGGAHDLDLDCGGATYEEATVELANLVHEKYGDKQTDRAIWVSPVIL